MATFCSSEDLRIRVAFLILLRQTYFLLSAQLEIISFTVPQVGPPSRPVPGTQISIARDVSDACSINVQVIPASGIFKRRLQCVFVCPAKVPMSR